MKYAVSIDQIDACLPQTQCQQCHYPRCRDYAKAILTGEAEINQCPPGGDITINALAELLNTEPKALNTQEHGEHESKQVARINEDDCIGCKKCITACPVSCIIGTTKMMHSIIEYDCTGCKLCVPVCPTDCIDMYPADKPAASETVSMWPDFSVQQVTSARRATQAKIDREARRHNEKAKARAVKKLDRDNLQNDILAAIARKQGKQNGN